MHSKSGSNFQAFSVNTFPPRTTLSLHSLPLCEQLLLLFCFSLVAKLVAQLALRRRHLNFEVGISFLTLKKADWVLCNSFYELEKQNDLVHGWGMDMKLGYCAQRRYRWKRYKFCKTRYDISLGLNTFGVKHIINLFKKCTKLKVTWLYL
ncbi:hypothetical protein Ahy_B03g067025 isoform C [Arachis hypogaea]|uniref:Uncharacterized protein n=1 Tax=Arachis hypogaea TaxID=3818 RepID=A0A445A5H4_ARAHY|nr:hypothetical protein Ahy_B03g067025 isoform C [Arachis hypogaea]